MTYLYSSPEREANPHALPDAEVFYVHANEMRDGATGEILEPGWYYAWGFPGCLWDSEPTGPFDTEAEAITDLREYAWTQD